MIDQLVAIADAARIEVPSEHRRPIAIVGAGAIVDVAHLPAYRATGLDVVGLYDLDAGRAREVAERHGVPRTYASLDELLGDPEAAVVDIAVVPEAQPSIVGTALDAGKDLLCQKPLALDPVTAADLVQRAAAAGRTVAVNQQLRFSESIAAATAMIEAGWIGELLSLRIDVDITTNWDAWPWLLTSDRLEVQYHSIHYLDAIRHVAGDPSAVFCRGTRHPAQAPRAETRTTSVLLYPGDLQATVTVNHENVSGDARAEFRFEGADGVIRGTFGLLYDYPDGRPDTIAVWSRSLPTDGWYPYPVTSRWLPDAFAGPMAGLLAALHTGSQPLTSAEDNLKTVCLVDALYRSMGSGQVEHVTLPAGP